MKPSLLVVDDEEGVRESFRLALQDDYQLTLAEDAKSTLKILKNQTFDLCLLDIMLPDGSGIDLLRQVKRRDETLEVVMVTAVQSIDTALEAMKLGAYDYITKPYRVDELHAIIKRVLKRRDLERENRFLREEIYRRSQPVSMVGQSATIQEILKMIEDAAGSDSPVLVSGEPGTGTDWVAQEIHRQGLRKSMPFVFVNCLGYTKDQLESEIFGVERDNPEGNMAHQIGKMEFADRGTLFLHQVERLSLELQAKLLKVFQEKKVTRLAAKAPMALDVRVIASTEADLRALVTEGSFREDLYRFLSPVILTVPPLRERRKDIPEMIEHFLKLANGRARIPVKTISKEAMAFLAHYSWPGNLRELENTIEMMALSCGKDTITVEDIPLDILVKQIDLAKTPEETKVSLKRVRRQFERQYIRKVLERTRGNQTLTAAMLGLHRNTLIWKLKELNMQDDYKRIVRKRRDSGLGFKGIQ